MGEHAHHAREALGRGLRGAVRMVEARARRTHFGVIVHVAHQRPEMPGDISQSGLSQTHARPSARAKPRLLAFANPRLPPASIASASGKRSRTIARLPSREPLSTTIVCSASPSPAARSAARQRASNSRVLKLTITIEASKADSRPTPGARARPAAGPTV